MEQILTTRIGLRVAADLTFETWERAGHHLNRIVDSSAWCLGDWLVYGQERFADRYRRAVMAAGLDYQTLRNYAWVARRFDWDRRHAALSFQHHAEVASLPPAEQDQWLDRAERLRWSRNQLRRAVRGARGSAVPAVGTAVLSRVQVSNDRVERWRQAAERSRSHLAGWVIATLDSAAAAALEAARVDPGLPEADRAAGEPTAPGNCDE
jgi:hypothetical protein